LLIVFIGVNVKHESVYCLYTVPMLE